MRNLQSIQDERRQYESLREAAERTGISERTLRRRISEGKLPAYHVGSRIIRVVAADVDRLMVPIPTVVTTWPRRSA